MTHATALAPRPTQPVLGEQLELDIRPVVLPPRVKGQTIDEHFRSFHDLNPWVLDALETLTEDAWRRGCRREGMKHFVEVLRWHSRRTTVGDKFKLNNNLCSRYARRILDRHPEWDGIFATREIRTP
jgi:hypothetical protein